MSTLLRWIKGNRPRAYGIAVVLVGWLALVDMPNLISTGLLTIIGLLLGTDVHDAVMPVTTAVTAVRGATTDAAAQVASGLNPATAGAAGAITEHAAQLVEVAADAATDTALRELGVKRKDRTR